MSDLRNQIAATQIVVLPGCNRRTIHLGTEKADEILALPAIAEAVALQRLCGNLTLQQVALALYAAQRHNRCKQGVGLGLVDDEIAIDGWWDE